MSLADAIRTDPKAKRLVVIIAAVIVTLILAAIANALGWLPDKKRDCIKRGVSYYKSIGSYPVLSDGSHADDVAALKCGRDPDMSW